MDSPAAEQKAPQAAESKPVPAPVDDLAPKPVTFSDAKEPEDLQPSEEDIQTAIRSVLVSAADEDDVFPSRNEIKRTIEPMLRLPVGYLNGKEWKGKLKRWIQEIVDSIADDEASESDVGSDHGSSSVAAKEKQAVETLSEELAQSPVMEDAPSEEQADSPIADPDEAPEETAQVEQPSGEDDDLVQKKKKNRRKRKRNVMEEEDAENRAAGLESKDSEEEGEDTPLASLVERPSKRRKLSDTAEAESKPKAKRGRKKKKKDVPAKGKDAPPRLRKLRELLKATGLANPRLYQQLKKMDSFKNQIRHLEGLFEEHDISCEARDLTQQALKRIKKEKDLERELASLGAHNILEGGRRLRQRKKISYKLESSGDEEELEEGGAESDGDAEYEAEAESEEAQQEDQDQEVEVEQPEQEQQQQPEAETSPEASAESSPAPSSPDNSSTGEDAEAASSADSSVGVAAADAEEDYEPTAMDESED